MIERQLKPPRAGISRAFGALVICATAAAALSGCADIPGAGPTFSSVAQAPAAPAPTAGLAFTSQAPAPDASAADNPELASQANKFLATDTPGSARYLVGPQDVLSITVFKAPDLSQMVQVAEDGTINLPLLGQVPVAGKTPKELERDIQNRLDARYMRSPQVTVFVKEFNSQRVTVEGAVRTPGVHFLRGNETLMQVIAKSGGLDATTAASSVVVVRPGNGGPTSSTTYDLSAIKKGEALDPQIMPGDIVVVDESNVKFGYNTVMKLAPLMGLAGSAAGLY